MRENAPKRPGVNYAPNAEIYDVSEMEKLCEEGTEFKKVYGWNPLVEDPPSQQVSADVASFTKEIGLKDDSDKLRFDLIPPAALYGLVEIVTFGAKKYEPENWKLVKDARRRYFAAAMRHGWAWFRGQKLDPETGKPHLWHWLCNVAFLTQLEDEDKI